VVLLKVYLHICLLAFLMKTRRERIIELLERTEHPMTVQDLAEWLDIKNRSMLYEDLEHVAKSVQAQGKELLMRPASCGKCGYVFRHRNTPKKPTKCPKCHSQWILLPGYVIRMKE
jgi:hypothetical protein